MEPEPPDFLSPLRVPELYDPLSEVTRGERKLLLLTSASSLALTWADLLPTSIDALGIDISPADRGALVNLLGLTVLYFLATFVVYARTDYARWRLARAHAQRLSSSTVRPVFREPVEQADTERLGMLSGVVDDLRLGDTARKRSTTRAAFDFIVPVVAGVAALVSICADLLDLPAPTDLLLLLAVSSSTATISLVVLGLSWALIRYNRARRRHYKRSIFSLAFYSSIPTNLSKVVPFPPLKRVLLRVAVRLLAGRRPDA